MAVYELEESQSQVSEPFSERRRTLPDRESEFLVAVRAEMDGCYVQMRHFEELDIVEVFMRLAAFNARASEIRSQIVRIDSRRLNAFRTRELEPFLETTEFQFKVWSRLQSVRQMEVDLTRGAM